MRARGRCSHASSISSNSQKKSTSAVFRHSRSEKNCGSSALVIIVKASTVCATCYSSCSDANKSFLNAKSHLSILVMSSPSCMSFVLRRLQRNTSVKECFIVVACILLITFCSTRSGEPVLPVLAAVWLSVYTRTCRPLKLRFFVC